VTPEDTIIRVADRFATIRRCNWEGRGFAPVRVCSRRCGLVLLGCLAYSTFDRGVRFIRVGGRVSVFTVVFTVAGGREGAGVSGWVGRGHGAGGAGGEGVDVVGFASVGGAVAVPAAAAVA
jgi:hypothetical protein